MALTPAQKQAAADALKQSAADQATAHEAAMVIEAAVSERAQKLVAVSLQARRKARATGTEVPPALVWADASTLAAKQLAAEATPKSTRKEKPAPAITADASASTEIPA